MLSTDGFFLTLSRVFRMGSQVEVAMGEDFLPVLSNQSLHSPCMEDDFGQQNRQTIKTFTQGVVKNYPSFLSTPTTLIRSIIFNQTTQNQT